MTVIAFDLDDTLFAERDFLHSAYRHIAHILAGKYGAGYRDILSVLTHSRNAFDGMREWLDIHIPCADEDQQWMVEQYRTHFPDISLPDSSRHTLEELQRRGYTLALITDGRINTQTNKIKALGLNDIIAPERIIISEAIGGDKLSGRPFEIMESICRAERYIYIGDNPAKDFAVPNMRGWHTICVADKGTNIHPQKFDDLPRGFMPEKVVDNISDILLTIQ